MPISSFTGIRDCVRQKVKEFCFEETNLTPDQIGGIKIKDLNLIQNENLPGLSPYEGLAANISTCATGTISAHDLESNPESTIDDIALHLNGLSQ